VATLDQSLKMLGYYGPVLNVGLLWTSLKCWATLDQVFKMLGYATIVRIIKMFGYFCPNSITDELYWAQNENVLLLTVLFTQKSKDDNCICPNTLILVLFAKW
jgi:hypothetical protein